MNKKRLWPIALMPLACFAIVLDSAPPGQLQSQNTFTGMVQKNTTKALKTFDGVNADKFLSNKGAFLDLSPSDNQTQFQVSS